MIVDKLARMKQKYILYILLHEGLRILYSFLQYEF